MWSNNRDDRGAGGPILRDPLANPDNRVRNQPYNKNRKNSGRQQFNPFEAGAGNNNPNLLPISQPRYQAPLKARPDFQPGVSQFSASGQLPNVPESAASIQRRLLSISFPETPFSATSIAPLNVPKNTGSSPYFSDKSGATPTLPFSNNGGSESAFPITRESDQDFQDNRGSDHGHGFPLSKGFDQGYSNNMGSDHAFTINRNKESDYQTFTNNRGSDQVFPISRGPNQTFPINGGSGQAFSQKKGPSPNKVNNRESTQSFQNSSGSNSPFSNKSGPTPLFPTTERSPSLFGNNERPPPLFPNNERPPPLFPNNERPPPLFPNDERPPPLFPNNERPAPLLTLPDTSRPPPLFANNTGTNTFDYQPKPTHSPQTQQTPGTVPIERVPILQQSVPRQNQNPFLMNQDQGFDTFDRGFGPFSTQESFEQFQESPMTQTHHRRPPLPTSQPVARQRQFNAHEFQNSFSSQSSRNGSQVPNNNRRNGPLLQTPKLVPYPPPPPKPSTDVILRNPRGILKPYSNFVPAGSSVNEDNSSDQIASESAGSGRPFTVVPYGDDDDDDEEFLPESNPESSEESHDFFSEKMVQCFASMLNGKSLEEQLQDLMSHLLLAAEYLTSRVVIVRNLHLMLTDSFQKCTVFPYGADFIGVGNSDDSVNVFVDLTGKQGPSSNIESTNIQPSELTKENVEQLLTLIQEDKNHKFFGQIVRRTNYSPCKTNLPVISFIHSDTKVRCNLRLDNYLLVQEAKVIQFICSLDTRIIPLLALSRYWSSVHKVLDSPAEDTKNRFVTLLMLFFLARKKIIPTMAHLQSLSVNREYFENIDIGFCDDYSLVPQNDNPALEDRDVFTLSTLSLLKEFFKLFASAKFKEEVVSLWKAEFIPKENFSPEAEVKVLPPDLKKRYRYGANGKLRDKRIDCCSRLCIQDFQDLTENLSLDIAEYDVSRFQYECELALKKLEAMMESGSGNLMDLFVLNDYNTST